LYEPLRDPVRAVDGGAVLVRVSVIVPLDCMPLTLIVIEFPDTVAVKLCVFSPVTVPANVDPDTEPTIDVGKLRLAIGVQSSSENMKLPRRRLPLTWPEDWVK
jgi:hypothetical protein